jgi:D-inositol-3-phosphate glycosyltransferase
MAERMNGLRWRLRAMRRLWRRGALPTQSFLTAEEIHGPVEKSPAPQPAGRIDQPHTEVRRGVVDIAGWVLFPEQPTARVEVRLGGRPLGLARLGVPRPDVAAEIELDHAWNSGFQLTVDLEEWDGPDGPATFSVVATSARRERFEIESEILTVKPAKPPQPPEVPPPSAITGRPKADRRPHVVVFTHQLNLGGAQLYLLDLLRALVKSGAGSFTMVSATDGYLRPQIEDLGIPVHISGVAPFDDLSCYIGRVEELTAWAADRGFDAALVNTATALVLPGVEAAELLGIPVVWAIHESFPPTQLWRGFSPEMMARAEAALARASALVLEAEATREIFEPIAGADRCRTLPYGLDLEPIDAHRREFDRDAVRRDAGISAEAELIVCIGTVEPRKAQLMLAQAFDLVAAKHPRAHLAFVGGRDDQDSLALRDYIESSRNSDRIDLIPVTPEVDKWYGMADILVCASDVESLPRTVLEAMAWETPVLATRVFGLPEAISDGETGWLFEPRDLNAFTAALERALATGLEERRAVGEASRSRVVERHALDRYGRQIGDLLRQAVDERA